MNAAPHPPVGIVIPTFNRVTYLRKTVESALAQTYDDVRVWVVDDSSSDGTGDYLATITDSRFRYLRNEANLGPMKNFQRCMEVLDPDIAWVNILADDDYLDADFIRNMMERVAERPEASVFLGKILFVDTHDYVLRPGRSLPGGRALPVDFLKARAHFTIDSYTSAGLYRRDAIDRLGGYPKIETGIGADDYLIYRLGRDGGIELVPEATCYVRAHSGSWSLNPEVYLRHAYALRSYLDLMTEAIEKDAGSKEEREETMALLDRHVLFTLKELLRRVGYRDSMGAVARFKGTRISGFQALHIRNRVVRGVEGILGSRLASVVAKLLGKAG